MGDLLDNQNQIDNHRRWKEAERGFGEGGNPIYDNERKEIEKGNILYIK